MFQEILRTKEFQRLFKETKKYQLFVENQWNKNKIEALETIRKISGLRLPNKTIVILITHPKLKNGVAFPALNIIGWGHPEEWKNYSIIYLCHELMHILVGEEFANDKMMHAIIELLIDNELRIRLNKEGKYFEKGIGHPALRKLERKIFPHWRKFLGEKVRNIKTRNIIDFRRSLERA